MKIITYSFLVLSLLFQPHVLRIMMIWDILNNRRNVTKTTTNLQAAIDWAHNEKFTKVK